jgi:hypothetical protein
MHLIIGVTREDSAAWGRSQVSFGKAGYGLVSSYGTLFGATDGGDLLTINQSTGVGTVIATGGPSVNGMASPPN